MSDSTVPQELVDHLCRTSRLTASEARQLVAEVNHFYGETVEQFLLRRHQELQLRGLSNSTIFTTLQSEIEDWRFSGKPMSVRQIRRTIYG